MLREIRQTPEDEAIEGAAEYTGIEPERLEAAIREYKRLLPDTRKADCHEELVESIIELRAHWDNFCDAEITPEGFIERMEACGFAELVPVTDEAAGAMFAHELGIEKGGDMWVLTDNGKKYLARATNHQPEG